MNIIPTQSTYVTQNIRFFFNSKKGNRKAVFHSIYFSIPLYITLNTQKNVQNDFMENFEANEMKLGKL